MEKKTDTKLKEVKDEKERPPLTEYDKKRIALKRYVKIFYDLQRIRIQIGGRVRATNILLFEDDVARLDRYEKETNKLENEAKKDVLNALKGFAFWRDVLSDKERYKGIGTCMAGVILSEFNINRADTPSDFWAFAGLGVKDGHAQRLEKGVKSNFNAWLRTKMVGVLADVLIKMKSPWTKFYYDYKHRKQSQNWGKNDAHRHIASKRYMIKMLLLDIWQKWRQHAGLPMRLTYQEEKLMGHAHEPIDFLKVESNSPPSTLDEAIVDEEIKNAMEEDAA